jgi:multicomponent Na+:H+ antiporter subunit E
MTMFLANIILALIWGAMSGEMTFASFLTGYIVGYIVLLLTQGVVGGKSRYFSKVWNSLMFILFFLKEMVVASLRVAYDVMTPTHYNKPGIIRYSVDGLSDLEITLLSKIISLTPGTLTLDVSADGKWIYIHGMFIDDPDELRAEIKSKLEDRLLEVLR